MTLDVCPNWCGGFGENSPPLTCGCARGAGKDATIWGANPYTWRSNICNVALHAGVIGPNCGQVVVTPEKVSVAPSVTRNGVGSASSGPVTVSGSPPWQEARLPAMAVAADQNGITLDVCPNWYGGFGENSPPLTCGRSKLRPFGSHRGQRR
jgi:hypothetical protein